MATKKVKPKLVKEKRSASAKEKKEIFDKIKKIINEEVPGFVMFSTDPLKGNQTHRLIGNRVSKNFIAMVAMSHCELGPIEAMKTSIEAAQYTK